MSVSRTANLKQMKNNNQQRGHIFTKFRFNNFTFGSSI